MKNKYFRRKKKIQRPLDEKEIERIRLYSERRLTIIKEIPIYINSHFIKFGIKDDIEMYLREYRQKAEYIAENIPYNRLILYAVYKFENNKHKMVSAEFMLKEMTDDDYVDYVRKLTNETTTTEEDKEDNVYRMFFINGCSERNYYEENIYDNCSKCPAFCFCTNYGKCRKLRTHRKNR